MALGLLSKNIKLSAWAKEGSAGTAAYLSLVGLQSIPSLGGDIDKVETTCLADGSRTYINGLRDYGDLEFKFLYVPSDGMGSGATKSNYQKYKVLEETVSGGVATRTGQVDFKVELADGTSFFFSGEAALSIDEADVNAAITYTMKIGLAGDVGQIEPTSHNVVPVFEA